MHDPIGSLKLLAQALSELNVKAHGDGSVTAQAIASVLQPHVQTLEAALTAPPENKDEDHG